MFKNLDMTVFIYVAAIALLMLANALFGAAKANKYGDFDWTVLKKSAIKYLLILLGVTFVFFAGVMLPEFKVTLPIIDETVTIVQMLSVVAIAILIKYVISCYQNLVELFGVEKQNTEV